MPSGLRRYRRTRQLHFGPFSCYRRRATQGDAVSRDLFESALERIRNPAPLRCLRFSIYLPCINDWLTHRSDTEAVVVTTFGD